MRKKTLGLVAVCALVVVTAAFAAAVKLGPAGNSSSEGVGYPAAYPECIAVSALGPTGKLSYYSSWGKQVAISAPGGAEPVLGEPQ